VQVLERAMHGWWVDPILVRVMAKTVKIIKIWETWKMNHLTL